MEEILDEGSFESIRENIQEVIDYNYDYQLKSDEELIEIICNFGFGETEFHTADIERLLKEKQYLQKKLAARTIEESDFDWLKSINNI